MDLVSPVTTKAGMSKLKPMGLIWPTGLLQKLAHMII
jgi:hypothetical protein